MCTISGPPEAICGWSGPGEVVKNKLVREARGKILDLAIVSAPDPPFLFGGGSGNEPSGGALVTLSASNWELLLFSDTERKSYACVLTYVPYRILLQQFSLGKSKELCLNFG